jgi:hypothetical protein
MGTESRLAPSATAPLTVKRLLPWLSEEGNPCWLVSDGTPDRLWRLADDLEAEQLSTAADVLDDARRVLGDLMSPYAEVRYAGVRLAKCLTDALRVAESRGMRLPVPDDAESDGPDCRDRDPDDPDDGGGAR